MAAGLGLRGICVSPIRGGEGNVEYLALYEKGRTALLRPDYAAIAHEKLHDKKGE